MDPKKNFRQAIVVSTLTKPTAESVTARRMMEAKEKINPAALNRKRDLSGAKVTKEVKGALEYLVIETSNSKLHVVSESKTADELMALIGDGDPSDVVANETIPVEEETEHGDTEPVYKSGDKLESVMGTYTVVEDDGEYVLLLDANNETLSITHEDLNELGAQVVGTDLDVQKNAGAMSEEATQVPNVPGPMGTLKPYTVTYKVLSESGEEEEKTESADSRESLEALIKTIENSDDYIETVEVRGPEDKNESMTPGDYRTDMGPIKILRRNSNGSLKCQIDGKCVDIDVSDLELLHPKKEARNDTLLRELYESTGISGRVSPDGRYTHLTGGRLRGPAVIDTTHLEEYVENAKRGALSRTPTFKWRG